MSWWSTNAYNNQHVATAPCVIIKICFSCRHPQRKKRFDCVVAQAPINRRKSYFQRVQSEESIFTEATEQQGQLANVKWAIILFRMKSAFFFIKYKNKISYSTLFDNQVKIQCFSNYQNSLAVSKQNALAVSKRNVALKICRRTKHWIKKNYFYTLLDCLCKAY